MLNFDKIVKDLEKTHAWVLGAEKCMRVINGEDEVPNAMLVSPFEKDSKADYEWFDGYMDVFFLHHIGTPLAKGVTTYD